MSPQVAEAYPLGSGSSGDTEPARMEVRHGTNVHPRSGILLFGEGTGFPLEHVTRINPATVRPGAGHADLSDTADRQGNVPQHSDPPESRPSHSEPDDGSCSSDTPRLRALNADTRSRRPLAVRTFPPRLIASTLLILAAATPRFRPSRDVLPCLTCGVSPRVTFKRLPS